MTNQYCNHSFSGFLFFFGLVHVITNGDALTDRDHCKWLANAKSFSKDRYKLVLMNGFWEVYSGDEHHATVCHDEQDDQIVLWYGKGQATVIHRETNASFAERLFYREPHNSKRIVTALDGTKLGEFVTKYYDCGYFFPCKQFMSFYLKSSTVSSFISIKTSHSDYTDLLFYSGIDSHNYFAKLEIYGQGYNLNPPHSVELTFDGSGWFDQYSGDNRNEIVKYIISLAGRSLYSYSSNRRINSMSKQCLQHGVDLVIKGVS